MTEHNFSEYGKAQIREIVRDELWRANRPFWKQIWRAGWIVLDAVAKKWGFSFKSAFEKRMRGADGTSARGRNEPE